ncbi:MAG: hypothetical protein WCT04_18460 [Planctomycetota bacterium]
MTNTQLLSLAQWCLACEHRIVWQFWMSILLLFVFIIIGLRGNAEDPRKNYPESHKALLGLIPPPIPPAENAAHVYRKAFAAVVAPASPTLELDSNTSRESAYFEKPELLAYVDSLATYYSLLDDATAMPKCNWELNYEQGFAMTMPHHGSMRHAARLLAIRARLRAHGGDHAGAARDLKRIESMVVHMADERTLLNTLVRISMQAIRNDVLQRIIFYDTPIDPRDIQAYRTPLNTHWTDDALKTFDGEFTMQAEMLDRIGMQGDDNATLLKGWGVPQGAYLFLGLMYGSERKTQRAFAQDVASSLHAGNTTLTDDEIYRRNLKGPSVLVYMTGASLSHAMTAFGRNADSQISADTALAILLFRAKHARDPNSLDELVSEFFPSVPVDAFNKKPLTLLVETNELELDRRNNSPKQMLPAGTLRVYSWGKNGVDDLGVGYRSIIIREKQQTECDDNAFFIPPMKK